MKNEKGLNGKQKIITGTVTSLGLVGIYTGGINFARSNPEYHNPIFISTIIVTFISTHVLNFSTNYLLKKYNEYNKKQKKLKK